jgi:endonuclease YncB( thermonuclease family)
VLTRLTAIGLLLLAPGIGSATGGPRENNMIVPRGETFVCTPVRVWDGDGPIWCAEGPRVRLAGIAARELDGSCARHHPCPDASGVQARDALVRLLGGSGGVSSSGHALVRGPRMSCRSSGSAGGNRTGAWCNAPRIGDLSCAMIRTRTVVRWARYDAAGRLRRC